MRVEKFKPEDFVSLIPRLWDAEKKDLLENTTPEIVASTLHVFEQFPSFTLWMDHPVACFGLILLPDSEAEAWVYFTPEVRSIKEDFEKAIRNYMLMALFLFGLKKVRTSVISGYEQQMPWVRRLGFKESGRDEKAVRYELCPSLLH